MRVVAAMSAFPADQCGGVVAIGNFDGLHRGHRAILDQVVRRARATGSPAIVYTFDPHPLRVLAPQLGLRLLQTRDQRIEGLRDTGIDVALIVPFTLDFAAASPEQFTTELGRHPAPRAIVVGHDFSYGHRRGGRVTDLQVFGRTHGIDIDVIEPVMLDNVIVSSTYIRQCLQSGDIAAATAALGRPYAIRGRVVAGRQVGRTIGYPTINLVAQNELIPPDGIYVSRIRFAFDGSLGLPAVTYIGTNPTFGGTQPCVETYVLTECPPVPEIVELDLQQRLRGDQHFATVEALQAQIADDVTQAKAFHGLG